MLFHGAKSKSGKYFSNNFINDTSSFAVIILNHWVFGDTIINMIKVVNFK